MAPVDDRTYLTDGVFARNHLAFSIGYGLVLVLHVLLDDGMLLNCNFLSVVHR